MSSLSIGQATPDELVYQRRINAWVLYDVANSAFFTTILAALLPAYYSQVAGATLPSAARATEYWSFGLSLALFISALMSPILGTMSDLIRGKKAFLAIFTVVGSITTGLLVLVGTGDWLLASALTVIGRIGAAGAIVFYDSLLPHVAKEEDQDRVSTRGYAIGYLGGGVLLAINVLMFQLIPDNVFGFPFEFAGIRLSFLSVGVWWILFSIPLFLRVPEPPTAISHQVGLNIVSESFASLRNTLRELRQYRELFKFLVAFLIYNDGIGTIIGIAVIYGAELGLGTTDLVLALLLVQFVGIPFSFIFGSLPNLRDQRRAFYLAFIVFNIIVLPIAAVAGKTLLVPTITGAPVPVFETIDDYLGTGTFTPETTRFDETWELETISATLLGTQSDQIYAVASAPNTSLIFPFNGQDVEIVYATGPDYGQLAFEMNGEPVLTDNGIPLTINTNNDIQRYGLSVTVSASEAGQNTLRIYSDGPAALGQITVLAPVRRANLGLMIGALLAIQALAAVFAWGGGERMLRPIAETLNTKRSILLSLFVYGIIASWGYFVNSTIEFWFLAWMVGIVQGGSQALSRSLYASMSPAAKSGEFFGLFSVMAKFSAITGPLLFAFAARLFNSSRPAIFSLIVLFIIGGYLLTRVDVEAGRQTAREENQRYSGASS